MDNFNRRRFIQASVASLLMGGTRLSASTANPAAVHESGTGQSGGRSLQLEWSGQNDRFRFIDKKGR